MAVVDFRNAQRTANQRRGLVIREGIRSRQLVQVGPVDHRLVDVAVFERPVELVRSRFEHDRHEAARGVPQLGRHARRVELHFLESVLCGRDLRIGSVSIADAGLLAVHAIDGVAHGARALPQHGEPADRIRARHVEKNANGALLAQRDLHQQVAVEYLARRGGLGIQQRRRSRHLHALRNRAHLELHVQPRHLTGADHKALPHVALESGRLHRQSVRARREIGRLVRALRRGEGPGGERVLGIHDRYLRGGHRRAGRIGHIPKESCGACGLRMQDRGA